MAAAYREDFEVQRIVRMLGALQLAPPTEWIKCISLIKNYIQHALMTPNQIVKLEEVVNYYK
jgi:hypothetical protein